MSTPTPTQQLVDAGVSIWLDDLSRARIDSGNLAQLIDTRNVSGVTTNPSIFQAAIGTPVSKKVCPLALPSGQTKRHPDMHETASYPAFMATVQRIRTLNLRKVCCKRLFPDRFQPIGRPRSTAGFPFRGCAARFRSRAGG